MEDDYDLMHLTIRLVVLCENDCVCVFCDLLERVRRRKRPAAPQPRLGQRHTWKEAGPSHNAVPFTLGDGQPQPEKGQAPALRQWRRALQAQDPRPPTGTRARAWGRGRARECASPPLSLSLGG